MGSTLLDGAVVEENCIIGAHSLVTMGTVIPAGHLALGSPAKPVRKLNEAEIRQIRESARSYVATGKSHAQVLSTLR
jgi:carbonic anhydrase/acetyltransferase-like protein (isoleucine patch superfamily)